MATRFGAVSPAQTYKTKMLWVSACLVTVMLILGFVAVMLWQTGNSAQPAVAANPSAAAVNPVASGTIDVLSAATRIEEGSRLEAHMFNIIQVDAERAPMAIVRAQDRDAIIGKFTKRVINPNMPLVMDDITDTQPLHSFRIPPGYRAVTIMIDNRSGVEGFAKPNSRVDVLFTYTQSGQQKVATIVRFVKVLSVGGVTQSGKDQTQIQQSTPATLLVTEKDAKKIELARTMGALSLSLVGDQEPGAAEGEPDTLTLDDLVGRPATQENSQEAPNDGEMFTVDSRTGKQIRYVLRNGKWTRDAAFEGQ